MMNALPVPKKSLFLAPMEGITDDNYRSCVLECFPSWDLVSTSFLRIPGAGHFSIDKILSHIGKRTWGTPAFRKKTIVQILASKKSCIEETVDTIAGLGVEWLDINLGCPSRKVFSHGGGSFLLGDLYAMTEVVKRTRSHFTGLLSVKIRLGISSDANFTDIVTALNDQGVDAIIVHARTRTQFYSGSADWNQIARAVSISRVPIIGNGDLGSLEDVERMLSETGCHSVMLGRGALKTPWLPELGKSHQALSVEFLLKERKKHIPGFIDKIISSYTDDGRSNHFIVQRLKGITRYLFEDFPKGEEIRRSLSRTQSLEDFRQIMTRATEEIES
jgi:tRNA-dihydrouridine synthase